MKKKKKKTYSAVFTMAPFLPNLISIFIEKIDLAVLVKNPYISQSINRLDDGKYR